MMILFVKPCFYFMIIVKFFSLPAVILCFGGNDADAAADSYILLLRTRANPDVDSEGRTKKSSQERQLQTAPQPSVETVKYFHHTFQADNIVDSPGISYYCYTA